MINNRPLTIALVAGEASGDMLGSGLIRAINKRIPNTHFVGVAGPLMQAEGCKAWYKIEELSVMGISEVFFRLHHLIKIRNNLIKRFIMLQPDVFVGIDSYDFNITIESSLKKRGIKTVHYVSPSIWAWRPKRVFTIGKSTNLVLVLFPFEKIFYEKSNIPCKFIGHSIADIMPLYPDKNAARDTLGIPHNLYCLALLPGSRMTELKALSASFLKTVQIIRQSYSSLEVIVPLINMKLYEQFKYIKANIAPNLQIRLIYGKSREVMIASDAALLASGTATLECMLAKCPMVVGYRMRPFTFWLAKHLVKINYISLPNLLAGRELVREFLQTECQPQKLAEILIQLLENKAVNCKIYEAFIDLHQQIRCNADEQAANAILELIKY